MGVLILVDFGCWVAWLMVCDCVLVFDFRLWGLGLLWVPVVWVLLGWLVCLLIACLRVAWLGLPVGAGFGCVGVAFMCLVLARLVLLMPVGLVSLRFCGFWVAVVLILVVSHLWWVCVLLMYIVFRLFDGLL